MTAPAPYGGDAIRVLLHLRHPPAFGLSASLQRVRFTLRDGFARTADQARRKILDMVGRGQEFALDVREQEEPYEVQPDRVELVAAWKDEP